MPLPVPGLVIHYSYLWGYEHRRGQEEGSKDRPCAVVVVVSGPPNLRAVVLGITHTKPTTSADGIELSPFARRRLGLDDQPSWIITTEANMFTWPGPDLRPRDPDKPDSAIYGILPADLLVRVRQQFRQHILARQIRIIPRTE